MNLGLVLAKPGESDLGIAMRLWVTNRGAWNLNQKSWDKRLSETKLINQISQKKIILKIRQDTSITNVNQYYQPKFFDKNISKKLLDKQFYNKPLRNCWKCSERGYHSFLYNYPWLVHCPVHHERLSTHCPKCSKPWPTFSNIYQRRCSCCGIRKSLEDLIDVNSFDAEKYEKHIPELINFFDREISTFSENRSYIFSHRTHHNQNFAKCNMYPSVLAKHHKLSTKDRENLESIGLPFHTCTHRSFKLNKTRSLSSNYASRKNLDLIRQSRNRVFELAIDRLSLQSSHNLGTCDKNDTHHHYECLYCESWKQLRKGFKREITERLGDEVLFIYETPFTRGIEVIDPGVISTISDLKTGENYLIPDFIKSTIYEIELWLCIKKMIAQIRYYLNDDSKPEESFVSCEHIDKKILSHDMHHFAHFNFVKSKENCELYFPKAYADSSIHMSDELLALFRETN